jgi:hypothetical protein
MYATAPRILSLAIEAPWLALLPACLFLVLYLVLRRKVIAAAALIWLAYAIYEYAMHRRWLCTGECDIRVDLLLLYPVLLLVSVVASVAAARAVIRRRTAA